VLMEPIELAAFTGNDLQNLEQLLLILERSGVDVRYIRHQVQSWRYRYRLESRRNKNKSKKLMRAKQAQTTVKTSSIPCPDCQKGYLQVKRVEDVTYTACPQCRKSVEFK